VTVTLPDNTQATAGVVFNIGAVENKPQETPIVQPGTLKATVVEGSGENKLENPVNKGGEKIIQLQVKERVAGAAIKADIS
jgi:hypothetical protein